DPVELRLAELALRALRGGGERTVIRRHSTIALVSSAALVLGFAVSTATATAPSGPDPRAELQRALDRVVAPGVPGALMLSRDGNNRIRLTSGYGNLAKKTPIRASDRFR